MVDSFPVDDEYNIEEEVSEASVTEINFFRNECLRKTEDNLNRMLIQNHEVVNKGCSRKKKSPVWYFPLPFWKVSRDDGAIWYYCTLCHFVDSIKI